MNDDARMSALLDSVGGVADSLGVPEPESPGRLAHLWDVAAPWIVGVLAMLALLGLGAVLLLAAEGKDLARQDLNSQNNHHASTVKKDSQLQQALNEANAALAEVKQEAAAIKAEGEIIIAAQQQGHDTLTAVAALQMEVSTELPKAVAGLTNGQAQINAYLGYLTCLGKNPTNPAVCGAVPTLPAT